MEMNIQHTKIELIQWLNSLSDSAVIQQVVDLRNKNTEAIIKTTVEEKKAIQYGVVDAENGKLNPHSAARKIYEKWL